MEESAKEMGETKAGDTITIEDVIKIQMVTAVILDAQRVEGSEKLVNLTVDIGEEKRTILAGIGKKYTPEELKEKQIVVIKNLAPRPMMGFESQGMLLACGPQDDPILLTPETPTNPGSKVR